MSKSLRPQKSYNRQNKTLFLRRHNENTSNDFYGYGSESAIINYHELKGERYFTKEQRQAMGLKPTYYMTKKSNNGARKNWTMLLYLFYVVAASQNECQCLYHCLNVKRRKLLINFGVMPGVSINLLMPQHPEYEYVLVDPVWDRTCLLQPTEKSKMTTRIFDSHLSVTSNRSHHDSAVYVSMDRTEFINTYLDPSYSFISETHRIELERTYSHIIVYDDARETDSINKIYKEKRGKPVMQGKNELDDALSSVDMRWWLKSVDDCMRTCADFYMLKMCLPYYNTDALQLIDTKLAVLKTAVPAPIGYYIFALNYCRWRNVSVKEYLLVISNNSSV